MKRDYLHLDTLPLSTADELAICAARGNGKHRDFVLRRLKPRGRCYQLVQRALTWYHAQEQRAVDGIQVWFCERAVAEHERVICPYCNARLLWIPCRACRTRHFQIHNGNTQQRRRYPVLAEVPMVRKPGGNGR